VCCFFQFAAYCIYDQTPTASASDWRSSSAWSDELSPATAIDAVSGMGQHVPGKDRREMPLTPQKHFFKQ